jgi:antitoxin CcdA
MDTHIHTHKEKRKTTTVTLPPSLLAEAKALNINLSRTLENTILSLVKENEAKKWAEENKDVIESMNAYYEKNDVSIKPIWMRREQGELG